MVFEGRALYGGGKHDPESAEQSRWGIFAPMPFRCFDYISKRLERR